MASPTKSNYSFSPTKNLGKFSELERYYDILRYENAAAKVIQRSWRRTRVLLPWRHAVLCNKLIVRIQKVVRGIIARKYVARWYQVRNKIVIGWQAHSRRFVINKHTRIRLKMEQQMAIRIQCMVRRKLAKIRCSEILYDMAARRIQMMWRGIVARSRCDKIWLFKHTVIPIQNIFRRHLAVSRYKMLRQEANVAATIIQKKYRNWISCRKLGDALFQREMDYRMNTIRMLTAEEELCQEKLSKLIERLTKNNFREKAEFSANKLSKLEEAIYRRENDYIEIKRQMDIISPRAMEQGYLAEFERNLVEIRDDITKLKIDHLFNVSFEVHTNDAALEDAVRDIEEWAFNRNKISEWRQSEYEERLHLNYQRDVNIRRRAKRQAIAEEKRRWQVLFYNPDGKPDKRRRPGRPWDASAFAGPEKMTYCGGSGVNPLANLAPDIRRKTGSVQSVENTVNQMSLQTYLEEVDMYERLLNPLTTIMQSSLGAPPGGPSLSQRGWGPVGEELAPALHGIGALPRGWQSDSAGGGGSSSQSNSRTGTHNTSSSSKGSGSGSPQRSRGLKKHILTRGDTFKNSGDARPLIIVPMANNGPPGVLEPDTMSTASSSLFSVESRGGVGPNGSVQPYEAYSSVSDLFRHSSRVRRKNKPKVSFMPSSESFSSSYRPSVFSENKAATNIELSHRKREFKRRYQRSDMFDINFDNVNGNVVADGVSSAAGSVNSGADRAGPLLTAGEMIARDFSSRNLRAAAAGGSGGAVSGLFASAPSTASSAAAGVMVHQPSSHSISSDVDDAAQHYPLQHSRSERRVGQRQHDPHRPPLTSEHSRSHLTSAASVSSSTSSVSYAERNRQKKAAARKERTTSNIPWELLDSLDGERQKFENEKAYIEFNTKIK